MRILSKATRQLAGGISRQRRRRMAGPAVLLVALMLTGGLWAVFSPAQADTNKANDADQVAAGRALFLVGCSTCHGANGEGIVTKRGNNYGPTLVGVGAAAVDFQVGTGRMPLAGPSVQAPRKEVTYNKTEISQMAAYVASLGPGPSVPEADEYSSADGEVVRGGEIFRTNCTACHNFAGAGGALPGGKYAPSLKDVSSKHIFEALLTGPQQMPVFSNAVLTPQDKRDVIAYLAQNDDSPKYGGFSMGTLGPVSEGLFAWLAGIGALVGFAIWIAAHTARARKGGNQ